MDMAAFRKSPSGRLEPLTDGNWAFIPNRLPPGLDLGAVARILSEADRSMGALNGMGELLKNPYLLIIPFTRREALLSSKIEGTQASLSELFKFEASGDRDVRGDVLEVANYVRSMDRGMERLKDIPVCARLVRELHETLLKGVRGHEYTPGRFRDRQNWIGTPGCDITEATYVPPPAAVVPDLIGDWEKFLNASTDLPPLVQCALMHYQFEAIHPFLDGNGRVGRLLITLYLCAGGHLCQPLLYVSAFFERNRDEYYDRLLGVSTRGEWSAWLSFFLRGVAEQSRDAIARSRKILALQQEYRDRLYAAKASTTALRLLELVFEVPALSVRTAQMRLQVTYPPAAAALRTLEGAGIVERTGGEKRNRIYLAEELTGVIEQDL